MEKPPNVTAPTEILQLGLVAKPRASEVSAQQCVTLLENALALAKAGEVCELILILDHPDNTWSESMTNTVHFPGAIGRLEMVKQSWVAKYLEQARGAFPGGVK